MPSGCYELCKKLKASIDARLTGTQVQSVGHKTKMLEYRDVPLKELIAYYNQVRNSCAEALADPELIAIAPLDQPTGTRGRPARFVGRGYV